MCGRIRAMAATKKSANCLLAEAIRLSGCSHAGLARRVNTLGAQRGQRLNYDKTSVSHWLSGTQPRPYIRYLIGEVLSERLGRPVTLTELGFEEPETSSCVSSSLIFHSSIEETLDTLGRVIDMDVERRSLLAAVPFIAGALIAPQRDWMLGVMSRLHERPVIAEMTGPAAAVRQMGLFFEQLDHRFRGGHARDAALRYLSSQVIPLLRQSRPGAQQRQLFVAAAHMTSSMGWMSYDMGEHGLAQRYMTQALRLCAEGGDDTLAGQILAGLSHLTTHLGDGKEGLNLAAVGIATSERVGDAMGMVRLQLMKARAHAALGERQSAAKAVHEAELSLDRSSGQPKSQWTPFIDSAYLAAEAAATFHNVADQVNAKRFARTAAEGTKPLGRRHTISVMTLAMAHLQQPNRDLDAAIATASEALTRLGAVSSRRSL